MTYSDLVQTIFNEVVAGAKMSEEVPEWILQAGELPRGGVLDYMENKDKGVGVSGQEHPD